MKSIFSSFSRGVQNKKNKTKCHSRVEGLAGGSRVRGWGIGGVVVGLKSVTGPPRKL